MKHHRLNQKVAARGNQTGVGLIEVLIAVLVLSIGMIGLAGLQVWSLRNNQSAMQRGMAVAQIHSIVDAMRADRAAATTGGFNGSSPSSAFAVAALSSWRTNLAAVLGTGASGNVACTGADCTVTVTWNDSRGTAGAADQSIVTEVQL